MFGTIAITSGISDRNIFIVNRVANYRNINFAKNFDSNFF